MSIMPDDPHLSPHRVKSDGGTTSYYQLPAHAKELGDLIEAKDMDFNLGNIFKACYRLGEKNDPAYEINKIIWFAARLKINNDRKQTK